MKLEEKMELYLKIVFNLFVTTVILWVVALVATIICGMAEAAAFPYAGGACLVLTGALGAMLVLDSILKNIWNLGKEKEA